MTDTTVVRPRYQNRIHPYVGNTRDIVAAAQRQMSEAFVRYQADVERIDASRRLDATEKVGAKLNAIREALPYVDHPEEIAELLLHTTILGKVLMEQSKRAETLRVGENYVPSLGHVELDDFVARYLNTARRPGRLVTDVILYSNDPTLQRMRELLVTDETISGNRDLVIPNEHLGEFTELFAGSPANGNGNGPHREIGSEEALRLINTGEWPDSH